MALKPALLLPFLTGLSLCPNDESLSAYGAAETVWTLEEINGEPFEAKANLTFPEPGKLSGEGPCNSYFGEQTAPYPWFEASKLASTKRACPELAEENAFFSTLGQMTLAEVGTDTLILSNDTGAEMVFRAKTTAD